jgi:hypothetical protein
MELKERQRRRRAKGRNVFFTIASFSASGHGCGLAGKKKKAA